MLSFGHLIPHSISTLSKLSISNIVPLQFVLVGFMTIFFIEKVLFDVDANANNVHNDNNKDNIVINNLNNDIKNTKNIANFNKKLSDIKHSGSSTNVDSKVNFNTNTIETTTTTTSKSAIILCTAMSFHNFIEAASLGLSSDATSTLILAASIALHQPAESIALLVAFLKSGMLRKDIVIYLSIYSSVSLLGYLKLLFMITFI
jgi:zinc transporter 1/2/3